MHGTGSEPGNTIEVFARDSNGVYISIGTTIVVDGEPSPTWTLDISNESAIPINDNEFLYAKEIDSAGNISEPSDTVHYYHGTFNPAQSEASDDFVLLGEGDDLFKIDQDDANDKLVADGGAGRDTAQFNFASSDAQIALNTDGSVTVTESNGDVNTLIEFERFKFTDGTKTYSDLFAPVVTLARDNDDIIDSDRTTVGFTVGLPVGAVSGATLILVIEGAESEYLLTNEDVESGQIEGFVSASDIEGQELTISAEIVYPGQAVGLEFKDTDILEVNQGPVASEDSASTDEDTAVTINVLSNDTDGNGDTLTVAGATILSGQGTVSVVNNKLVFTPEHDFNGVAEISYTISDGQKATSQSVVSVTVNSVNDAPTITVIGSASISEEGLVGGNRDDVGQDDTTNNPSASGTFSVSDVDGDSLSLSIKGPTGIFSNDLEVQWNWNSETMQLIGFTQENTSVLVISLTEENQGSWNYEVTINQPLDHTNALTEDVLQLNFDIVVDDGTTKVNSDLVVNVEDDSPTVQVGNAVVVSVSNTPDVLVGTIDFTGNGSVDKLAVGGVLVTGVGFVNASTGELGAAKINSSSGGIGVQSSVSHGHSLANEVEFRNVDGEGVSEQLVIDLDGKVAYGASIQFEYMFGDEKETGVAFFYRDGVLVATQEFSSDASSGNYAKNFSVSEGGFDKVVLQATDNGNPDWHHDNSDFTVKSITFIGASEQTPIASASDFVDFSYGADGAGHITLVGSDEQLYTQDGVQIQLSVDASNSNRLVGYAEGAIVFELQFTPATGKWEYYQYQVVESPESDGDIDFEFAITDGDGDTVVGTFAVVPLVAASVENITLTVSEEGLLSGLQDSNASHGFQDTTDSSTSEADLVMSDNVTQLSLGIPSEPMTSQGYSVSWTLSNDGATLTGFANGQVVITISVDGNGKLSSTLEAPLDHSVQEGEDSLTIEVPVTVANEFGSTATAVASIVVEDDSPNALRLENSVASEPKSGANVQLVLDISGSMNKSEYDSSQGEKVSRLDIMKASAHLLLAQYEAIGETRVQIITFNDDAEVVEHDNSVWLTVSEAYQYIDKLSASNQTDYDDALAEAAQQWNVESGGVAKISGGTNVSYFLSDGKPEGKDGHNRNSIDDGEERSWISHLIQNDVTALAYGLGSSVKHDQLDKVAYDGEAEKNIDSVIVENVSQLPPILLQSVIPAVSGSLTVGQSGADGSYVSEISIQGVTFSFNGTTYWSQGSHSDISHSFDLTTNELSIFVDAKHSFVIDMSDGSYQFYGADVGRPVYLPFGYQITDSDGDSSANQLVFTIDASDVVPHLDTGNDSVDTVNTLFVGTGVEYTHWSSVHLVGIPETGTISHQETVDGLVIDVGGAGDDVYLGRGDDVIYLGDSHTELDINANMIDKQLAAQIAVNSFGSGDDSTILLDANSEDGALNVSASSDAFIDIGHGGGGNDHIYGQGGSDLIFGGSGDDVLDGGEGNDAIRGGSGNDVLLGDIGNDILVGGSGNDLLVGGSGDDMLTGGSGSDTYSWKEMETATDRVTDFSRAEKDAIDLADLFSDVSKDDISELLSELSDKRAGETDSVKISVTGDEHSSTMVIEKGNHTLTVDFDGASASDITSSLMDSLEHLKH
ncbi:Ig-like domain-containing protein [Vibrio scophthalmi]|uniref:Ig-like domain-containing protein n=1 Tax=Vibrio scophthalmi TaxID=45658 RepID=UPI002FF195ED